MREASHYHDDEGRFIKRYSLEGWEGFEFLKDTVEKICTEGGYEKDNIEYFIVANGEAYKNAWDANKKYGIEGPLDVELFYMLDSLTVTIPNYGIFDPFKREEPLTDKGLPKFHQGGLGLLIIQSQCDEFEWSLKQYDNTDKAVLTAYLTLFKDGAQLPIPHPNREVQLITMKNSGTSQLVLPSTDISSQVNYASSVDNIVWNQYHNRINGLMRKIGFPQDEREGFSVSTGAIHDKYFAITQKPPRVFASYMDDTFSLSITGTIPPAKRSNFLKETSDHIAPFSGVTYNINPFTQDIKTVLKLEKH